MPPCPMGTFLYTVGPGDTIWLIAQRYNTTVYAISAANPGIDLNNLYVGQVICLRPDYSHYSPGFYPAPQIVSKAEADLKNNLRNLWEQHVEWTRMVIMSIVFGLPDADQSTARLLRNPKDFEAALKPFYGVNSSKFAALFTSHLVIATQLVKAAKAGDSKAAAEAEKDWYANADRIAAFLAGINPYWSEKDWKSLLYKHLALTKSEAVDMLKKKYAESISTYDEIEKEALEMADVMTQGVVRQFHTMFA